MSSLPFLFRAKGAEHMRKVTIRSVVDGFTFELPDDGHAKDSAQKPRSFRAQLERTLKEKSQLDGEHVFFLIEKDKQFVDTAGHRTEAIDARVWNAECDERLANHLAERSSSREARAAGGAVSTTGARHQLMAAIKESEVKAADVAAATTGRDSKSKAKKEEASA